MMFFFDDRLLIIQAIAQNKNNVGESLLTDDSHQMNFDDNKLDLSVGILLPFRIVATCFSILASEKLSFSPLF